MAAFDNFASLQKKMESLPPDELQKYIDGQGAIPQEEQMAALFAQAKRAGLELGEQAKQPVPSGTVAENINHKAVLNHLQDIANKSGMQITGVAPVNAGLGAIPQGAPQAPMAPPVAPSSPPVAPPVAPPAPAPQPAPMPQGMAHGGITHAVPHHMFRFSHGGGIMGFDGTDGSSVDQALAAVNQAMPANMPANTNIPLSDYLAQRQAALKAVAENNPGDYNGPRQATLQERNAQYAERDARMHNQPNIYSDYSDPLSLANISKMLGMRQSTPDDVNKAHASAWGNKNLETPVPGVMTAQGPAVTGTNVSSPANTETPTPFPVGYTRQNMANDPRLNVTPPTPTITPAANPNAAPNATPNATPATPTTAIPPQTRPQAGLGALIQNKPSVKPTNKPVEEQKIPGTENNLNYMALEDKQLTEKRDILDEIKKQELVQAHYGLNNPYGIEAEKRAAQLAAMYSKINEEHPYERLLQVLTGIGTGGLAGAAPAYLRSEGAFREAQQAQFDNINKMLSPIEAARREEARANASSVLTAYNDAEKERKKNLAEMAKTQLTGKQEIEKQGLAGTQAMDRTKLESATQLQVAAMQKATALAGKDATAEQIAAELAKDPAFAGKSYAERMTAAYAIKQGARPQTAKDALTERLAKDWGGFDVLTKKNWADQGITTFDQYLDYMQKKMSGNVSTAPAQLLMPPPDKLTAYASTHFGGDIEKAKQFLASKGYK